MIILTHWFRDLHASFPTRGAVWGRLWNLRKVDSSWSMSQRVDSLSIPSLMPIHVFYLCFMITCDDVSSQFPKHASMPAAFFYISYHRDSYLLEPQANKLLGCFVLWCFIQQKKTKQYNKLIQHKFHPQRDCSKHHYIDNQGFTGEISRQIEIQLMTPYPY